MIQRKGTAQQKAGRTDCRPLGLANETNVLDVSDATDVRDSLSAARTLSARQSGPVGSGLGVPAGELGVGEGPRCPVQVAFDDEAGE